MLSPIEFEMLLQRLQRRFPHPVALAAATSEIHDCRLFTSYLNAVVELHPNESPFEAVYQHACTRGEIWEPAFGLCTNE